MKKRTLTIGIVLSVVAALAVPMTVLAEDTSVTGTQAASFEFTQPSDIVFGTFSVGANATSATPGSVVTNDAGWTLTVAQSIPTPTHAGFMTIDGLDVTALASPLGIGIDAPAAAGASNSIADYQTALQGSSGYGGADSFSIPLFVNQPVVAGDIAGSYSITLTYTATPAS